jgi:hypothetical protein
VVTYGRWQTYPLCKTLSLEREGRKKGSKLITLVQEEARDLFKSFISRNPGVVFHFTLVS